MKKAYAYLGSTGTRVQPVEVFTGKPRGHEYQVLVANRGGGQLVSAIGGQLFTTKKEIGLFTKYMDGDAKFFTEDFFFRRKAIEKLNEMLANRKS